MAAECGSAERCLGMGRLCRKLDTGDGTENNPYLIENARQLAYIAEMVNAGVTHYDSTYFKLTTDVYIDSATSWQPIGLNGTYYFGGHFNGNNRLITIYLTTSSVQYAGIFGYVKNGSIFNLGSAGKVKGTSSSSDAYAGGICGYAAVTTITNCCNKSNISSSPYTGRSAWSGGICGASSTSIFTNCKNIGIVTSSSRITSSYSDVHSYSGGICGSGGGDSSSGDTITNCCNSGNIYSYSYIYSSSTYNSNTYANSGGICGTASGVITNCYNTGIVNSLSSFAYTYNYPSSCSYYSYSGGDRKSVV